MAILHGVLGLFGLLLVAVLLSEDRRRINPKLVAVALLAQLILGAVLLRAPFLAQGLAKLSAMIQVLEESALAGATFMFGYLVTGPAPFDVINPDANFLIAFRVLPLILLVSALSAVLFHVGVLPWVIRGLARVIQRLFKVSGALAFAAASSVFFGIIEGPILVKPYLGKMARHELFALMTCGMATVAGTVMVLYAAVLESSVPGALGHILIASLMSIPSALVMAHVLMPGGEEEEVGLDFKVEIEKAPGGVWGALMKGTEEGTKMIVAIIATLVVLFALVHLVNQGFALIPVDDASATWTLQRLAGVVLRPLVFLMGVPWHESGVAGELMGSKLILNEFVAYLQLKGLPAEALSPKSRLIMTYGMCGFANLGSLGILVGGLSPLVPERQQELTRLATKAILAGTLATATTGAVVGLVAP